MSIRRSKLPNWQIPEMTALDATSRGSVCTLAPRPEERRATSSASCGMESTSIFSTSTCLGNPKSAKTALNPLQKFTAGTVRLRFFPSADCHVSLFDRQLPQHQIRHSQRCHSSCPDQYIVQPLVSQPVSRSRKAREYLLGA